MNSDLTFSHTFRKEGSGRGQFFYPLGIACDSTGIVYVSDNSNHRIRVFTAEGRFLRMFGKRGQGKGELDVPSCVAIDLSDLVHVSEAVNNRVSVFTSEGHFVTSFSSGKKGRGPREFDGPCGLAIDLRGVVYVCDCNNDCVQVFNMVFNKLNYSTVQIIASLIRPKPTANFMYQQPSCTCQIQMSARCM